MIDTAEMYGSGRAEVLVGRVARSVGRDRVFITTKLLPHHFSDEARALSAAKSSLKRLGVMYADLVLIHWPNAVIPIHRQVRALEAIAREGLARYVGVSNFEEGELEEALMSTARYDIVVNQVKYSPLDRRVERGLLQLCIKEGVTVQAYTPLERCAVKDSPVLKRIGAKYGKTPIQVALNYLISRPYVAAIPKTERAERVEEFRGALGWRLSSDDIEVIEEM